MPKEKVAFEGHAGDQLAARLDMPPRAPRAYALFAHCFTCGKDIAAARRIASALTAAGIAVLRFDFTGLGHSEGEFAHTGFTSNVDDLLRAADWLRQNREAPQLLIGHSLGGAAVLAAAPKIPEAKAVVSIGAPADPAHVLRALGCELETIKKDGEAEVALAGRPFRLTRAFVDDIEAASRDHTLGAMHKALLVLHAPRDEVVGIDNATRIFLAAKHPKSFVTLDDADHLISRESDARYVAGLIAAWAERYLAPAASADPGAGLDEGFVRSSEAAPDAFLQDVVAGGHRMLADEPASVGGADLGPSPYQYLAAGLAACTSMTIRMYARRKGLPLSHVHTDVRHDKVHAEDCADCETKSGKIDQFERVVTLEGDLSPADRQKLLEIADKCPVHRTLEGEITVRTRLA